MAHPKRKISKTRRNKRRTHYKAQMPNVTNCPNCKAPILWHHVCDSCGQYRGQQVIQKNIDF